MNKYSKDIIAIAFSIISISVFFALTGSINSGYHLTDDHEIIRITRDLSDHSFFEVVKKWVNKDMNIRYRPMYFVNRVFESKLFGNNFTYWSLFNVFLLLISMLGFYFGMRKLKFSIFESLGYIFMVFIGEQMAIWWRLGPNETIGMFFLGIAFLFMVCNQRNYTRNTAFFAFFLILASLSKESFTIVIPAFLVFKIWHEKQQFNLTWKEAILKNKILIIPFIVLFINIFLIVFKVGTNKIGYAGVDGHGFLELLNGIGLIIDFNLKWYLIMILLFFLTLYYLNKANHALKFFAVKLALPFVFFLLIIIPNLVLYAKSGMDERYLLPALIGVVYLLISIVKETRVFSFKWSYIFLSVIFLLVLTKLPRTYFTAKSFTVEGIETNKFLNAIVKNYPSSPSILLVVDPVFSNEWASSTIRYLHITKGIDIYAFILEDSTNWVGYEYMAERLRISWEDRYNNLGYQNMSEDPTQILFLQKNLINPFFEENSMNPQDFSNMLNNENRFTVFIKHDLLNADFFE